MDDQNKIENAADDFSLTPPLILKTEADNKRFPSPKAEINIKTTVEKDSFTPRSRSKSGRNSRSRSKDLRSRHNPFGHERSNISSRSNDRKPTKAKHTTKKETRTKRDKSYNEDKNRGKNVLKSSKRLKSAGRSKRSRSRSKHSERRKIQNPSKQKEPAVTSNSTWPENHIQANRNVEVRTTKCLPSIQYSENGRYLKIDVKVTVPQDIDTDSKPGPTKMRRSRSKPPSAIIDKSKEPRGSNFVDEVKLLPSKITRSQSKPISPTIDKLEESCGSNYASEAKNLPTKLHSSISVKLEETDNSDSGSFFQNRVKNSIGTTMESKEVEELIPAIDLADKRVNEKNKITIDMFDEEEDTSPMTLEKSPHKIDTPPLPFSNSPPNLSNSPIPLSKSPAHLNTSLLVPMKSPTISLTPQFIGSAENMKRPDAPIEKLYTEYEQFLLSCEGDTVRKADDKPEQRLELSSIIKDDKQTHETNDMGNIFGNVVKQPNDKKTEEYGTDPTSSSSSDSSPSSSSSSSLTSSSTESPKHSPELQSEPRDIVTIANIASVPKLKDSWDDVSNIAEEEELMSKAAELANTIAKRLGKKGIHGQEKVKVPAFAVDDWDVEPKPKESSRCNTPDNLFESVPEPEEMLKMLQKSRPTITMKLNALTVSPSLKKHNRETHGNDSRTEEEDDFTIKLSEKEKHDGKNIKIALKSSTDEVRLQKRSISKGRSRSPRRHKRSLSATKTSAERKLSPSRSSSSRSKKDSGRQGTSSNKNKTSTSPRQSTPLSLSRAPSSNRSNDRVSSSRSRKSPRRRSRSPLSTSRRRTRSRSPPHKRSRQRTPQLSSPIRRSRSPVRRSRSPVRRSRSPVRRSRSPSRRSRSPILRSRSPIRRSRSPIRRSRSPIRRSRSPFRHLRNRTRSPSPNRGRPKTSRQPRTPPHPAPTSPCASPNHSPIPWPDHYGYGDFQHIQESYQRPFLQSHEHYRSGSLSPKRMALDHRIARVLGGYDEDMDHHQNAYGKYHGGLCGPPILDDESFVYPEDPAPMCAPHSFSNLIEIKSEITSGPMAQFALQKGNVLEIVPKRQMPEVVDSPVPTLSKEEQDKQDAVRAEQRQKRKQERDKIRLEKFMRKEKLKLELQSLLEEEMSMIGENDEAMGDDGDNLEDPVDTAFVKAVYNKNATVGKSCLRPEEPNEETSRKKVLFSDGVRPGDGTSPSDSDDTTPLPLRDRNKKAMKKRLDSRQRKKMSKLKKSKKGKILAPHLSTSYGHDQVTKLVIEPELENMPPPSPPAGDPPPNLPQPTLKSAQDNESVPRLIYFHYNAKDNSMYVSPFPKPQQPKTQPTDDQPSSVPTPINVPPQHLVRSPLPLHPTPAALLIRPPPLAPLPTPVTTDSFPTAIAPNLMRRIASTNRITGSPPAVQSPSMASPTSSNQYRWPTAEHTILPTATGWEPITTPSPSPIFQARNPPELLTAQSSINDIKNTPPPSLPSLRRQFGPPPQISTFHPIIVGASSNPPLLADPPLPIMQVRRRHSVAFNRATPPPLIQPQRHLLDMTYSNAPVRFGTRAPLLDCGEHINRHPMTVAPPVLPQPTGLPGVHSPSVGLLSTPLLSVQQLHHHQIQMMQHHRMAAPETPPPAVIQFRPQF